MGNRHWYAPLDPECPKAKKEVYDRLDEMNNDPMTAAMGAPVEDFAEEWERKHRAQCKRCQAYGAENIDVQ